MKDRNEKPFGGRQVRIALVRETPDRSLPAVYAKTPQDIVGLVGDIAHKDREHFVVVLLNTKNRVLGVEVVSIGTLDASLVSAHEIFKSALLLNAANLVAIHNHPSGDPTPSAEDIRISKTLKQAGELMNIRVLDHVILGADSHVSLREEGLF